MVILMILLKEEGGRMKDEFGGIHPSSFILHPLDESGRKNGFDLRNGYCP
jgi:hypothetical protein